jgi:hypothetical protein
MVIKASQRIETMGVALQHHGSQNQLDHTQYKVLSVRMCSRD